MATKNTNVTFGDISTQVSNRDASDKSFNIFANARINDNKFAGLESGSITKTEGEGNGYFQLDQSGNFSFGCNGFDTEEIEKAVKSVLDFYNDVKEAIESKED